MAAGKKFEVGAVCNLMVLMLIMGVPYSAQAQCHNKIMECSTSLSSISVVLSQYMQNATALEAACSTKRPGITTCIADGRSLCNADKRIQLDMIESSFENLCGPEMICRSKAATCQIMLASGIDSNPEGSEATVDALEMIKKICPAYGQASACLDALDDSCKDQEIVKNVTKMIAEGSQYCGGSSGDGNCLGPLMKCSSIMQNASGSLMTEDGSEDTNPFAMIKKICPAFLEMESCLNGLSESCKDHPLVKNATAGMSSYGQMCAGFAGTRQCGKVRECETLLSNISPKITELEGNVTAVEVECRPQRSVIKSCVDATQTECKTEDERKQLYAVKTSFEELCGPDPSSGSERFVAHTVFWTLAAVMTTMTSLHLFF